MAFVYWIHLKEHTDMFTQGYVGITSMTVAKRFNRHQSAARRVNTGRNVTVIQRAVLKHGDNLIVNTILEASIEYCQDMEMKIRSKENIGWNIAIGGAFTRAGCKNSAEHIAKVALANTGKKMSPEVVAKNSALRKAENAALDGPWQHNRANKYAWTLVLDIYKEQEYGILLGRRSVAKRFNIGPDSAGMIVNKIKSGWNPKEDQKFLNWLSLNKEGYETTLTTKINPIIVRCSTPHIST